MTERLQRGFTLIEIMVASFIFAVLSAAAFATFNATSDSIEIVGAEMARLQQLQRTVQTFQLDFSQLSPRPVREELGSGHEPALVADLGRDYIVELTRGGWSNPLNLPRPALQRAAYRLEEDRLIRVQWPVLDRTLDSIPREVVMIDQVERFELRFLPASGSWAESWPPQAQSGPANLRLRPRAVEIIITLTDFGEIRRLIEVTG